MSDRLPDDTDAQAWALQCEAHDMHLPIPRVLEHHTIVPRVWQEWWRPAQVETSGLWWPERVTLCPAGHSNTHFWIERIVSRYTGNLTRAKNRARNGQQVGNGAEVELAHRALDVFAAAGGSIQRLIESGVLARKPTEGDAR